MYCDFHLISPFTLSQPVQLIGSSQPISLQPASDLGEGLQFEQAVGVQTASTSHLCYQLYFHQYIYLSLDSVVHHQLIYFESHIFI